MMSVGGYFHDLTARSKIQMTLSCTNGSIAQVTATRKGHNVLQDNFMMAKKYWQVFIFWIFHNGSLKYILKQLNFILLFNWFWFEIKLNLKLPFSYFDSIIIAELKNFRNFSESHVCSDVFYTLPLQLETQI